MSEVKSVNEIIADFDKRIPGSGARNSEWYVGVATNAYNRLTVDHGLENADGRDNWAWRQAASSENARQIEKLYLEAGLDGGPGGGDASTSQVYVCLKSTRFRR